MRILGIILVVFGIAACLLAIFTAAYGIGEEAAIRAIAFAIAGVGIVAAGGVISRNS
jgi:hypothetical protein